MICANHAHATAEEEIFTGCAAAIDKSELIDEGLRLRVQRPDRSDRGISPLISL